MSEEETVAAELANGDGGEPVVKEEKVSNADEKIAQLNNRKLESLQNPKGIRQLPAEYDDTYMSNNSRTYTDNVYSQDINRRMQVPGNLSGDGNVLHEMEIEAKLGNASSSRALNMVLPDKLTLDGWSKREPVVDPYNEVQLKPVQSVDLKTPPHILTSAEEFPMIEDESEVPVTKDRKGISEKVIRNISRSANKPITRADLHSTPIKSDIDISDGGMDLELSPQRRLEISASLEDDPQAAILKRIAQLEMLERSRSNRELLIYPLLGIYAVYKILSWFTGR